MVDGDAVVHADSLVELQDLWRLVDRLRLVDVAEGPAVAHEFEAPRQAEVAPEADPVHRFALGAVLLERRPRNQDAVVAVVITEVLVRVDVVPPRVAARTGIDRPRSRNRGSTRSSQSGRKYLTTSATQADRRADRVGDGQTIGGDLRRAGGRGRPRQPRALWCRSPEPVGGPR